MTLRRLQLLCCSWMMLLVVHETIAFSWNSGSTRHQSTAAVPTRKDLFALKNTPTKHLEAQTTRKPIARHQNSRIEMRDRSSSYWFTVGDRVRVVDDVLKGPQNLKGKIGKVVETWEKCDVDPTCCCAEQVDTDMAVRVVFEEDEESQNTNGNDDESTVFYYYFAEEELVKV